MADTAAFGNLAYGMPGGLPDNSTGWNNFMAAQTAWINSHAPGSTVTRSELGSASVNTSFLLGEIADMENVELFISGGGVAHAIDLTGISCTAAIGFA